MQCLLSIQKTKDMSRLKFKQQLQSTTKEEKKKKKTTNLKSDKMLPLNNKCIWASILKTLVIFIHIIEMQIELVNGTVMTITLPYHFSDQEIRECLK